MIGSFGNSDFLRFDKTVPTNVQTVRLRAETRGLINVDKVIEYVICPATGGNTIVKPIPYWDQIVTYNGQNMQRRTAWLNEQAQILGVGSADLSVDLRIKATGGEMITLTDLEHYMQIDVGATGTSANIPFNGWAISDVYRGCGSFEKYSVQANSSTISLIQFPEPGLTLADCTQINQCLNVRVIDTSTPKIIRFTLHLHPVVGQDSVSIPFVIDLTPCRLATITVPEAPPDLTLDRTDVIGNTLSFNIEPTYKAYLVNSQPTYCPYLEYDALNSNGAALASQYVSMLDKKTPATTKIVIKNDVAFVETIRIKAFTMSKNQYMSLNIRVCGTEQLSLIENTKRTYITGQ